MEEKAIEFALDMEEELLKSAEKGFSSYRYEIRKDHKYRQIFCSGKFAKLLEELMDGVKVRYKIDVKQHAFLRNHQWYEYYIIFDWGKKE